MQYIYNFLLLLFFRIVQRRQWGPSIVNWYLAQFKTFLNYCDAYEKRKMNKHFCLTTMLKALRDTKRKYANSLAKYTKETKKERLKRVPSLQQVVQRTRQVCEVLANDLEEKKLSVSTLKALNFFLLQTRLNVRPGPILNITWKCFDSHLKLGRYFETNEHKTGKYFDVAISMEQDQIQFMEELRT